MVRKPGAGGYPLPSSLDRAAEGGQGLPLSSLRLPSPYLLFLGDAAEEGFAKTAFGIRDWAPSRCIGEFGCPNGRLTLGLPRLTPAEAVRLGAESMVIGVANAGGFVAPAWIPLLCEALEAGLDLISGLHTPLSAVPTLKACAERHGSALIDVRRPPADIPVGTGRRRTGRRALMVGTDCAVGKKYTALAIAKVLKDRGTPCDFRATGQTGIIIAGGGMPMDAVVSDFEAGAAELLSPDAPPDHWDIIEGQGSLLHPAYAAVSLGLLHGSQPDAIVVCHDPTRQTMLGLPGFTVPAIEEIAELSLRLGSRTNALMKWRGVALNTSRLSEQEAERLMDAEQRRLGVAVADPVRGGARFEEFVSAVVS